MNHHVLGWRDLSYSLDDRRVLRLQCLVIVRPGATMDDPLWREIATNYRRQAIKQHGALDAYDCTFFDDLSWDAAIGSWEYGSWVDPFSFSENAWRVIDRRTEKKEFLKLINGIGNTRSRSRRGVESVDRPSATGTAQT